MDVKNRVKRILDQFPIPNKLIIVDNGSKLDTEYYPGVGYKHYYIIYGSTFHTNILPYRMHYNQKCVTRYSTNLHYLASMTSTSIIRCVNRFQGPILRDVQKLIYLPTVELNKLIIDKAGNVIAGFHRNIMSIASIGEGGVREDIFQYLESIVSDEFSNAKIAHLFAIKNNKQ